MKPGRTADILAAIATLHSGDRERARDQFGAIWGHIDPDDRFHRCVVAHYMADAQTDPVEELRWDQIALAAATGASPAEFDDRFPGVTLASFRPSLHLALAADYERLGELTLARVHAAEAADAAHVLPDGDLTRAAIHALGRRLR